MEYRIERFEFEVVLEAGAEPVWMQLHGSGGAIGAAVLSTLNRRAAEASTAEELNQWFASVARIERKMLERAWTCWRMLGHVIQHEPRRDFVPVAILSAKAIVFNSQTLF